MYTLMYKGDPESVSDAASVVFTLPQNACYDITEMCDLFDRFLKATGYYPPANSALQYVDYSDDYKNVHDFSVEDTTGQEPPGQNQEKKKAVSNDYTIWGRSYE